MHAIRSLMTPVLALVWLLTASGAALSQSGTPEAPGPATPPETMRRVPGITVLPPADGPAARDNAPSGQQGGEAEVPQGGPGCQFRENKLELIV